MNLTCKLFGHVIADIDSKNFTATCGRCKTKLNVSYDMSNGQTIEVK
jgi:hypothetical protein